MATIQDLKSPSLIRTLSDDLEEAIQKSLRGLAGDSFTLSIYFGENLAKRHQRLSRLTVYAFLHREQDSRLSASTVLGGVLDVTPDFCQVPLWLHYDTANRFRTWQVLPSKAFPTICWRSSVGARSSIAAASTAKCFGFSSGPSARASWTRNRS